MKTCTFLLFIFICISCKREGCTNENALNYESNALKDDGSCTYDKFTFFTANKNIDFPLSFYLDNKFIGYIAKEGYTNTCSSPGSEFIHITLLDGNVHDYFIKDCNGILYNDGSIQSGKYPSNSFTPSEGCVIISF